MRVAVEGCAHGDLDNIYATLQHLERSENTKVDLLICCGDFQAMRNEDDLESMACPAKYRVMNSYWKYYCGQKVAPYPTLFIGGNHEASNHLWELYYGGWAAPNIFFLGLAGVMNFGGIRIGGLSGIYKPHDYHSGHYERAPYSENEKRSAYHVRSYDVLKLMQVKDALDVFISHDWPRGITKFGNEEKLLRNKPFLKEDVEANRLGSRPAEQLLNELKPTYWFSAHMHTKFAAVVQHPGGTSTKFLALDKCLPRRQFLQVVDFPEAKGDLRFTYDEEWLAITLASDRHLPLTRSPVNSDFPNLISAELQRHREWVRQVLMERGNAVPSEFSMTAPPYDPSHAARRGGIAHYRNQFTVQFLELLALPYKLDAAQDAVKGAREDKLSDDPPLRHVMKDPNEISLDDDDAGGME